MENLASNLAQLNLTGNQEKKEFVSSPPARTMLVLQASVKKDDDDEIKWPTYFCMICGEDIPVLASKYHRTECSSSLENDHCPLCDRKRRHYIMEAHIAECAQRRQLSTFEKNKEVALYSCGKDVIERAIVGERNNIINGYKRALHLKTESPFGPCYICTTYAAHTEGNCLRILGGYHFKKRAQRAFDSKVLSKFENYLKLIQDEKENVAVESFKKKWERKNPGTPCDTVAVNSALEKKAKKWDHEINKIRDEKHEEVKKLIDHHDKVLGNKLTRYRDHFIRNYDEFTGTI